MRETQGELTPDLLAQLNDLEAGEAAERLDGAFDGGAGDDPVSLDSEVVDCLLSHPESEVLLGLLPPTVVAAVAEALLDRLDRGHEPEVTRHSVWNLLDALRDRSFRRRLEETVERREWADRITRLIDASQFTFPRLFEQRAGRHPGRTLFVVPGRTRATEVSWRQVAGRVDLLARGLIALTADDPDGGTVAILSHNRLEMALVDLACLTSGLVNVMIPATASDDDIAYILGHAKVATLVVSSKELTGRARDLCGAAAGVRRLISLDGTSDPKNSILPLETVLERAGAVTREALRVRRDAIRPGDRATVMYTSGTTGTPKGICFSHRNIVSKRFHRALALPEIGEDDRFLSYLPLFHTFGRFLEMTGSIFWGATYVFAESPAIETLIRHMKDFAPTVFISIPMKWIQLFEQARAEIDVELGDDEDIRRVVRELTGGSLAWGLSAAGYLDPDIFRFFQRNGIELMSGFGMTEATGGITMTPPGRYREDSLGPALPGVDITVAEDGELLVRGAYVMEGYLDPPDGEPSFDENGWFHTGDLMEMSPDGFIRIIDRKKEIYKNVKGQTIAPQKVENLFRDFDSINRIFLVGDHRAYNTALIHPNMSFAETDFETLDPEMTKDHFRSLVVSANTFLSPFERIVDFAIIDRDFSAEQDELTPKGTYRRKNIERNFATTIRHLYQRATLEVGGAKISVPNWLFQALGVTAQDLKVSDGALSLGGERTRLRIRTLNDDEIQVGPVAYTYDSSKPLNLGSLLSAPKLWIGNEQLVGFAQLEDRQRAFKRRRRLKIGWKKRLTPYEAGPEDQAAMEAILRSAQPTFDDIHRAALLQESGDLQTATMAVRCLEHILETSEGDAAEEARRVLRRATDSPSNAVVRRAFEVLAVAEQPTAYRRTLSDFLERLSDLFSPETTSVLVASTLSRENMEAIFAETEDRWRRTADADSQEPPVTGLLTFLADYGAHHPSSYRPIRAFITKAALGAASPTVRQSAREALDHLLKGFRTWLGSRSKIAVDPETGFEYRWDDVVAFADDVDDDARERLTAALRSTPMLREGIFLFSGGATVDLSDILPGGVWIRLLGSDHGKSVYRIAVKTRSREQYDLAVNLRNELPLERIAEEIDWLVVCSAERSRAPLAEEFGGWWPEQGLWTEEFIGGDTLDRGLRRLARKDHEGDRFVGVWPHAAWAALAAYVDFWDRTGRRLMVADPTPGNVVVPLHDYHTDARLVSISARREFTDVASMLLSFKNAFIDPVQNGYESLAGLVDWDIPCSALLEVVGEKEGITLLRQTLKDLATAEEEGYRPQVNRFLTSVESRGFLPRRLFFAAKRFRRWNALNPQATRNARARTLQEIYSTYGLHALLSSYPEARARFFRETVFRDAPDKLADGLDRIMGRLRSGDLEPDELSAAVADLRAHLSLENDDDYFLARLSYPYLRPEDVAEYVAARAAGVHQSEMVVTLEDAEGDAYSIRHAISAKEVGRLHRLFLAAKLSVQFRPEHRFLVAVNQRGRLLGGLFYEVNLEERTAHMDKIVVADVFRGRGIAGQILDELCNRLRASGITSLTTGFFRPQFFYRYGFSVERRYAGLVRPLAVEEDHQKREQGIQSGPRDEGTDLT